MFKKCCIRDGFFYFIVLDNIKYNLYQIKRRNGLPTKCSKALNIYSWASVNGDNEICHRDDDLPASIDFKYLYITYSKYDALYRDMHILII